MKNIFLKIRAQIGYFINAFGAMARIRFTKRKYSELINETKENYSFAYYTLSLVVVVFAILILVTSKLVALHF
ncbi:MAG TPA: hypothetical protein VGQ04_11270 [Chitinophagaceae bacterium]|jgi:hypothetical protein|nr:hypothetical protein [Chitinophagaceae bacterium]